MQKYVRYCPDCNRKISYKRKNAFVAANKKESICRSCAMLKSNCKRFEGHAHSKKTKILFSKKRKGVKKSDAHKIKIGNANRGKIRTNVVKNKISKTLKKKYALGEITSPFCFIKKNGKNNPMFGKKHNSESLRKMRLSSIHRIEENKNNGNQIKPAFNKNACNIIEHYGEKHNYNFQHAMNGGEFYIKELGYWVDGYDKDKNVVIEYYENRHKKTIEKDEKRKLEIVDYLGCKFIELKQWELQHAN